MNKAHISPEQKRTQPLYFLAAHAYCCEFDDGAVLLELRTGRYLGVHAHYLPYIRARVGNWPVSSRLTGAIALAGETDSAAMVADLLAQEILTRSPTPAHNANPPMPLFALGVASARRAGEFPPLRTIARFAAAVLRTAVCHGDNRLATLLSWIQRHQRAFSHPTTTTEIDRALPAMVHFLQLRLWCYTANQKCLFDSLAIATYLTSQAVACTFVIGVSTKPFAAHAWVQMGQLVLNDTAEHVNEFTPILAIGACT